jgi:hypothetical protein
VKTQSDLHGDMQRQSEMAALHRRVGDSIVMFRVLF